MPNTRTYLHLVLTSDSPHYNEMYKITNEYYKKFDNVTTVYYQFLPELEDDYLPDIENNILYLKGTESHLPGILDKTLKTFFYFKNDILENKYDYIVRSNVSTVVNFHLLDNETEKNKIEYGGAPIWSLAGLHPQDGVMKPEYLNISFVQGNSIILHNDTMKEIINNIGEIDYNVIDDVALGVFIKFKCPNIVPYYIHSFNRNCDCNGDYSLLNNAKNYIINNNKNNDRAVDVQQIKYITSLT